MTQGGAQIVARNRVLRILFGREGFPHLLAVGAFVALVFVSSLLWLEIQRRFPVLPPGSYAGFVQGPFEDSQPVRIYVERAPQSKELFFLVLRDGWAPLSYPISVMGQLPAEEMMYPIDLRGPDATLRLVGKQIEATGRYSGIAKDLDSGREGSWSLHRMNSTAQPAANENDKEDFRYLIFLQLQKDAMSREIKFLENQVGKQSTETNRLTAIISEGEELRRHGEARLSEVRAQYQELKGNLEEHLSETRRLQEKISLSEKVTKMGKVVSLAREAQKRENRWIDSMLQTASRGQTSEFREALGFAREIGELRHNIDLEYDRIRRLDQYRSRLRTQLPSRSRGVS